MLSILSLILTLTFAAQSNAQGTIANCRAIVDHSQPAQLFCKTQCGRTLIQCTGAGTGHEIQITDPTMVCSDRSSSFLDYWHNCVPPTPVIGVKDCMQANQIKCPVECGKELIKCIGYGAGYKLVIDDPNSVCSTANQPAALDSVANCKPPPSLPEPFAPPPSIGVPASTPVHGAPTPTHAVGTRTPTPVRGTPTPAAHVTPIATSVVPPPSIAPVAASTSTVAVVASSAAPVAAASTVTAASYVSKADQAGSKSSAGGNAAMAFANVCAAGVAAVFLQLMF
ncbi:hypothetical protein HDU67_007826 [Dinochytrium kinnereticum]|nr:hypothetical protein HDU67_007826 [Dinochytrium kinnereticum]